MLPVLPTMSVLAATMTLRPDAAGDETNITSQFPASGLHYAKVDEESVNGDTDYVYTSNTSYKRDLYNLPVSSGVGVINNITIHFTVRATGGMTLKAKPSLKSNGTVTDGTEVDCKPTDEGGWTEYTETWAINNGTNTTWEWADIDDLQIGVSLKSPYGGLLYALCTQVSVTVSYVSTTPTITTNNATYVSRTTARFNSYLVDDGGEPCDVRFQYSTAAGGDIENFTTYTEVDNNSHIALVGTDHVDFDAYNNEDAYLYDNKTTAYFTEFEHLITVELISTSTDWTKGIFWAVSNDLDDAQGWRTNDKAAVYAQVSSATGANYALSLVETYNGTAYADNYTIALNTPYYCTITKAVTAMSLEVYTDSNRTVLVDTLNLTLHAAHNFQYVFAANTVNAGVARTAVLDIDNLTLSANWTSTAWVNDTYNTGDSPYTDIANLTSNTTYYYRAQARNALGITSGSVLNFTTYPTINEPTNFTAYPDSTTISLTWTKGVGATYTMIRGQAGAYPANYTDGKQVYAGSMATATDSNLTPGTTYYYRSWSYDGAGYSTSYTDILMTTTAFSEVTQETPTSPTTPSAWWGIPDYTNLENIAGYGIINDIADNFSIPRNTFWMSGILIGIMCIGLFIYSVQHNATVAIILTGVMIVVASIAGLLPLLFIAIIGIPAAGVFLVKRRV